MAIKKVWIEEGCTACELCADICPEVFDLPDDTAVVKKGDLTRPMLPVGFPIIFPAWSVHTII